MATVNKRGPWAIWKDVIFALFVREIRTGFNDKFGISWSVIQPVAFIFILSFIRGRMDGGDSHTIPTFVYMAYGLILVQSFLQTLSASAQSIAKAKTLFAFRQVQPISAVIATSLFELLVKVFVAVGIVLIMYFLGLEIRVDNPLLIMVCFVLLWLLSMSIGLMFGVVELYVKEVKKLRDLASRPMFFISGVFFSLQDFPREYWYLLDWNPVLHAIELSRYAAYTTYGQSGVSLEYLSLTTLCFTFLAMVVYNGFWRQAISR